ncbi:unnamed protein product [Boreogadus saida]
MFLTYILALIFLAIFGFTAIPVFLFFNMWTTCSAMKSPLANITAPDSICMDVRQYGIIPWNATPGKACGAALGEICDTSEVTEHRSPPRISLLLPSLLLSTPLFSSPVLPSHLFSTPLIGYAIS